MVRHNLRAPIPPTFLLGLATLGHIVKQVHQRVRRDPRNLAGGVEGGGAVQRKLLDLLRGERGEVLAAIVVVEWYKCWLNVRFGRGHLP